VAQSVESVCKELIKHPDLETNAINLCMLFSRPSGRESALGKETQLNLSLLLNPRIINQTLDVVKQ
jgi:hypothetical protein